MILMLSWSDIKYRFTLGLGSLATTAIMAELWKPTLPLWVILVVALLPLVIFIFVHPEEMPAGFVRVAHVFASAWYVLSVVVLSIGLWMAPELPDGWIFLLVLCSAGLAPTVYVLGLAILGRYRLGDSTRPQAPSPQRRLEQALRSSLAVRPATQGPLILRPSRSRAALLFFVCALFVGGGIWMVRMGNSFGYFCAGFFALGLPVFALHFHPKAAYLCLTADSFTYCSLFRAFTVRWEHVRDFAVITVGAQRMVAWNLTPHHPMPRRVSALSKSMSGYEAALPDTYGMKPEELLELMEGLRLAYVRKQDT